MSRLPARDAPVAGGVKSSLTRRLGLLLLLMIVGHDLIMAVAGVASPGAEGHGPAAAHGPLPAAEAGPHQAPLDHPGQCGVGQGALSRPAPFPDQVNVSPDDLNLLGACSPTTFISQPLPRWHEPHPPQGILRAFIQVFLV